MLMPRPKAHQLNRQRGKRHTLAVMVVIVVRSSLLALASLAVATSFARVVGCRIVASNLEVSKLSVRNEMCEI